MCGIAGYVRSAFEENNLIRIIQETQKHRGPDFQDYWQDQHFTLIHQRLSIIDLDKSANQPMIKGEYVIVFNGEIYNYQSLKQALIQKYDSTFQTNSDTEVLLELFRHKGALCLNELEGMFSFAIYNRLTKKLFLARDPFGIKPLFYLSDNDKFAFASELKTLTKFPGFNKSLNMMALTAAMNYLWLPGVKSMFKNVNKLAPGHYMIVSKEGEIDIKQYYHLPTATEVISENEAVERLDAALNNSIARHLVADVPISCLLSGGLDSSLIVSMASSTADISTYSIAINGEDKQVEKMPDDARYARKLANQLGLEHHEILITPNITNDLPKMVYHLDEPIGDPAAINTYLISKAAHEDGRKVLLSGMGADEIFFGYRRQKATLLAMQYQSVPAPLRKMISGVVSRLPVQAGSYGLKTFRWAKRFLSFANLPVQEAYMRSYSYYNLASINALFSNDMQHEFQRLQMEHTEIFNTSYENDPVNQMCYTDINMFMHGLNLTYTDRASMAASVEVRVPFIDKEVIELAMALPANLKYHKRTQKYLLKKTAEKYLAREFVYRPKASFGAPIRSWVSGSLQEMISDLLNKDTLKNRGIFNPDFVHQLINDDKQGRHDNAYQIYQLITLELWFQNFVDK